MGKKRNLPPTGRATLFKSVQPRVPIKSWRVSVGMARSNFPEARKMAIKQLFQLDPKKSIPVIRKSIVDTDLGVVIVAVETLNKLNALPSIPYMVRLFRNRSVPHPFDLAEVFSIYTGRRSIPLLEECLHFSNADLRSYAIGRLALFDSSRSAPLIEKCLLDSNANVRHAASDALSKFGKPTELYSTVFRAGNVSDFTNPHKIRRVRQWKDGSGTILLGGPLYSKATVRIISPSSYEAWKKAFEAGLSVEPILCKKNGTFRAYSIVSGSQKGYMRVSTAVIQGASAKSFLDSENNAKYRLSVKSQVASILSGLEKLGIVHGHAHLGNFVVHMQQSQKRSVPKVFLVDFDKAYVK